MNDRIYIRGADNLRKPERVNRLEVERVVDLCLNGNNFKSILDIGIGSGLFGEAFSKKGIKVSGIDLNSEMIEAAKEYLPDGDLVIAQAEDIPFPDKSFDASFFGLVLHEVSDYKKALSEAFRVSGSFTFILEWQYKAGEFGPPLEHRLKPAFIEELAMSSGYREIRMIELDILVLYILFK